MTSFDALQRPSAFWASDLGSWSPPMMARMMAWPDLPSTSLMTVDSLMFICSIAFCMCCTSRLADMIMEERWRVRLRIFRAMLSGWKQGFTMP